MSSQIKIEPPLSEIEKQELLIAHVSIEQFIPENKLPTSYTTKFGAFLSHSVDTDATSTYPKLGRQPQTTIDMFQMISNQTLQNIRYYLKTNTTGILAMQKATDDFPTLFGRLMEES